MAALLLCMAACGRPAEGTDTAGADPQRQARMEQLLTEVRAMDQAAAEGVTAAARDYIPPAPENTPDAAAEPIPAMTLDQLKAAAEDEERMAQLQDFFADTLFIGDSRTVGLQQYAGVSSADFFALTGMSVFDAFKNQADTRYGKLTLEQLLQKRQYSRIYLMLGINELGYKLSSIEKKYDEVVVQVQTLQPQAQLWLQANLHVTRARSEKDAVFNNTAINNLNESIRAIAQNRGAGWLDVNPVFDDAGGDLDSAYTFDHTHVLGKYYKYWILWIWYQTK